MTIEQKRKARMSFIAYSGYPEDALWLHLDNGMALLAGVLESQGHSAQIYDFQTLDVWAKLFNHPQAGQYLDLRDEFRKFSLRWKPNDTSIAREEEALIQRGRQLDLDIAVHNRRVASDIADECISRARVYQPTVIGMKLWGQNCFMDQIYIAERLKKEFPDVLLCAGGPAAALFRDHIFRVTDAFDLVSYGNGEETILGIADYSIGQRDIDSIPGIVYRQKVRSPLTIISEGTIPGIKTTSRDERSFTASYVENYDRDVYLDYDFKMKSAHVEESRGCNFKCQFCIHPGKSGLLNQKAAEQFVDEVATLNKRYGFTYFHLASSDPQFNHLVEISKALDRRDLHFGFFAFLSLRNIKPDEMKWLQRGNFDWFWVGIESGAEEIVKGQIIKGRNIDRLRRNFEVVRNAGIFTTASLIVPSPGETEATFDKTIALVRELGPNMPRTYPPLVEPESPWFRSSSGNVVVEDQAGVMMDYMRHGMEWHPANMILPMVFKGDAVGTKVRFNGYPYREVFYRYVQGTHALRKATRKIQVANYRQSQQSSSRQKAKYFEAQVAIDHSIKTGNFEGLQPILNDYNDLATCGTYQ